MLNIVHIGYNQSRLFSMIPYDSYRDSIVYKGVGGEREGRGTIGFEISPIHIHTDTHLHIHRD